MVLEEKSRIEYLIIIYKKLKIIVSNKIFMRHENLGSIKVENLKMHSCTKKTSVGIIKVKILKM